MQIIDINKALSDLTKPEHPVLVVSGLPKEKPNVMVAGWVMRTSFSPPLMAVSIGLTRHTHSLMEKGEYFVFSYPGPGQETFVELAGNSSGRNSDKFSGSNEPLEIGKESGLPLFKRARVNFECKKSSSFETGDHTVFVGQIISALGNPGLAPLINVGNYRFREFEL